MDAGERYARFEYDPDFVNSHIELAPMMMPLRSRYIYQFTDLPRRSFHGLPGLLADSLPDKYGNNLIDVWLARQGRSAESFNAVDRLCYTGSRGMGALEFEPSQGFGESKDTKLDVEELVKLASLAFARKSSLETVLDEAHGEGAIKDILKVGTSAGGARAKAIINFNPQTQEVRSGQFDPDPGFSHWLIKFDGVEFNGDWGIADPAGYGLLEYSYYEIAKACEINMMESRLLSENGRHHFMTRRFDRGPDNEKYFTQTFAALKHFDYWESGYHSYEQLFMTMKQLELTQEEIEEQFKRVIFNLVGRNQDDHVKNFAFIMNKKGAWRLSPAYDMCHAEGSDFTRFHQLSINNKQDDFTRADLKHLADYAGLPRGREKTILEKTVHEFSRWHEMAGQLNIPSMLTEHVMKTLRLKWSNKNNQNSNEPDQVGPRRIERSQY
jgi:serine/threonine-protein kinase HipA